MEICMHLALAAPTRQQVTPPVARVELMGGRRFSGRAWVSLVAVLIGLAIFNGASAAIAAVQPGDRNAAVTVLQTKLQQLGYFNGPITGYYGPLTRSAVLRLQQQYQLAVDGVVGVNTQAVLDRLQPTAAAAPSQQLAQDGLLRRGSRGDAVAQLQRRLTSLGYAVPSTGYWGAMTEAAVVQFQRDRGLKPDALVGTLTAAALDRAPQSDRLSLGSLRQGSRGEAVVALQQRLAKLGYFTSSATGYFGPVTEAAVFNFQRDYRLQPDGVVGANTLTALDLGRAVARS